MNLAVSHRGAAAGAHCLDLSALHGTGATGANGATGAANADETHVGAEARNGKWAFDDVDAAFIIFISLYT